MARSRGLTGIVALVPDRWEGIWMPRHQVLYRLARHFEVIWVEPAMGWRHYWLQFAPKTEVIQDIPADQPGFTLYRPGRWRPEVYRPRFIGDWLRVQRVRDAERLLRRKGCDKIVLYLWRPEFRWAVGSIGADLTCYHIDDEYRFSVVDQPNDPREVDLIRDADLVIIHSRKLFEKKGMYNPQTVQIPNGVDYQSFSVPQREPADLAAIPRPRIGYVGVVKVQLDLELLSSLAARHPRWSLVMVGPVGHVGHKAELLRRLAAMPNVHLLGNKPLTELPGYCQHMDVCMMCYEVSDYTKFIYPLKLHEYLATGRPVVSAPIDAVLPFTDVLQLASGVDEWSAELEKALAPERSAAPAVEARRARAKAHDWEHLVLQIANEFRRRLE